MPLFEYICNDCGRKFTALIGMIASSTAPACPECGSADLKKLISRFSTIRSEDYVIPGFGETLDTDDASDDYDESGDYI